MSKTTTPEFRLVFPSVFEPSSFADEEPNYSITAIFDPGADLSTIERLIDEAIAEKWKERPSGLRTPLRDQSEKEYAGFGAEGKWLKASSKFQPKVYAPDRSMIVDPSEIYSGCYCRASISAWCYDFRGNRGVSLNLLGLLKTREGDRIGSVTADVSDFDGFFDDSADLGDLLK
jgi:hypothetical protein